MGPESSHSLKFRILISRNMSFPSVDCPMPREPDHLRKGHADPCRWTKDAFGYRKETVAKPAVLKLDQVADHPFKQHLSLSWSEILRTALPQSPTFAVVTLSPTARKSCPASHAAARYHVATRMPFMHFAVSRVSLIPFAERRTIHDTDTNVTPPLMSPHSLQ